MESEKDVSICYSFSTAKLVAGILLNITKQNKQHYKAR